jgi:hypothetical protein
LGERKKATEMDRRVGHKQLLIAKFSGPFRPSHSVADNMGEGLQSCEGKRHSGLGGQKSWEQLLTFILVGEQRGNRLVVMGEEFSAHHESNPPE